MDYVQCSFVSYWLLLTFAWACVSVCLSVVCAGMCSLYTEGLRFIFYFIFFNAVHSSSPALRNSVEFYFFLQGYKNAQKAHFFKV